ncbi:hypothetical protein [Solimonas marina]|uniref:Uncharacterized protein n=1 Tax=Solimonas marina TaxID=2714601 RepID=A0A970B7J0_9GAMM|nr:hypothetical protein [Solimonas marina]NKF21249.1 hypothetical protein [Solimonas marina]
MTPAQAIGSRRMLCRPLAAAALFFAGAIAAQTPATPAEDAGDTTAAAATASSTPSAPTPVTQTPPAPSAAAPRARLDLSVPAHAADKRLPIDNADGTPEIIVHGKRDAIADGDRKLKAVTDALPCGGCDSDAKIYHNVVTRSLMFVGKGFLPTPPDPTVESGKDKATDASRADLCSPENMSVCGVINAP